MEISKRIKKNTSICSTGVLKDNSKNIFNNPTDYPSDPGYLESILIEKEISYNDFEDIDEPNAIPASIENSDKDDCNGTDERKLIPNTLIAPWKMICRIYFSWGGYRKYGTGFFIGPKCVITSGHVVVQNQIWSTNVRVYPGVNYGKAPFGFSKAESLKTVIGWFRDEQSGYDYGAIILKDDTLFKKIGSVFGYVHKSKYPLLNIAGNSANMDPDKSMWVDKDKVSNQNTRQLFYSIDTYKGTSGAPAFYQDGNHRYVCGVHSEGGCPNSGVRVNTDVIKNFDYWKIL